MKSMVLSEEEILYIKSFIQDVSNIPAVECVYLVPYFDRKSKKEKMNK